VGRERALIYKTLLMTGLRYGELRSVTVAQCVLDGPTPHINLAAKDEKARRGAQIPLQASLAAELSAYLENRRKRSISERGASVVAFRSAPGDEKLFPMPGSMRKAFEGDCRAAGIPKRDERGRTVALHALRHTFGTWLSQAGVPLQLAQRAMRHSDPKLTANIYTHLTLVDVAGATNALPDLSRNALHEAVSVNADRFLPPFLPLTSGKTRQNESISGKTVLDRRTDATHVHSDRIANNDRALQTPARCGKEKEWWAVQDSNLRPPACKADALTS